jgi:hypothetical protein
MNNLTRPHLFGMIAGLFLAAGLVFSAMLGTTAWVKIHNAQFISVKGSARKSVKSDLAVWTGNFATEAETLLDAQRKLADDRAKVEKFLDAAGMTNRLFASIVIEEVRARFEFENQTNGQRSRSEDKTVGYRLKQSVEVRSANVDGIAQLNASSTSLVEQGVFLTAEKPKYLYTKVAEDKIEMLADATKDARARAEKISEQGGGHISRLHSADMGVFQITPVNSVETSWEGMNDTTSVEKTITAVVTASFALD